MLFILIGILLPFFLPCSFLRNHLCTYLICFSTFPCQALLAETLKKRGRSFSILTSPLGLNYVFLKILHLSFRCVNGNAVGFQLMDSLGKKNFLINCVFFFKKAKQNNCKSWKTSVGMLYRFSGDRLYFTTLLKKKKIVCRAPKSISLEADMLEFYYWVCHLLSF